MFLLSLPWQREKGKGKGLETDNAPGCTTLRSAGEIVQDDGKSRGFFPAGGKSQENQPLIEEKAS